eukprot:3936289-Rhodomonas_salina.4
MSGTDLVHAATSCRSLGAYQTGRVYGITLRYLPTRCVVLTWHMLYTDAPKTRTSHAPVRLYLASQCPVLRWRMVPRTAVVQRMVLHCTIPNTETAYGATVCNAQSLCPSSAETAYGAAGGSACRQCPVGAICRFAPLQPWTLNPKPQTLGPQPAALNPKPES